MRLERYLISWVSSAPFSSNVGSLIILDKQLERKGKVEEGIKVWDDLVKLHPRNYQSWIGYTEYLA
jgi:hypothetical protein